MKLGKYFTLDELIVTKTKYVNVPGVTERIALMQLVKNVLEPLREMLGEPITVNSGYRSPVVNKEIGGATNSQHVKGEAADIKCSDNAKLFRLIRENFVFDQLIWEAGDDNQPDWVHVSYKTQGNRCEVLKMKNKKYTRI